MTLVDNLAGHVTGRRPAQTPDAGGTIAALTEDTRPSLPSGFVRRTLDMRDAMLRTTRSAAPGYIHASSLAGMCPRQWNLMRELGVRQQETVRGGHRVMWEVGRAVENRIRRELIEALPRRVYGAWRCPCEDTEIAGFKPSAEVSCSSCGMHPYQYHELTLTDDESGTTGNPDIIINHEQKMVVVEVKSMVGDQWAELTQPVGNHVVQALSYRRLLKLNGYDVHNDVVVLYCNKNFKFGSPYKEYHLNGSVRVNEERIDHLFARAKLVKDHEAAGTLPARTVCHSLGSKRAKACPVGAQCFERSSA